jgi:predicted small secreted protein
MKIFITLSLILALNSCNTMIGAYRDAKQGYQWTKDKIQGSDSGGGGGDVVPVY